MSPSAQAAVTKHPRPGGLDNRQSQIRSQHIWLLLRASSWPADGRLPAVASPRPLHVCLGAGEGVHREREQENAGDPCLQVPSCWRLGREYTGLGETLFRPWRYTMKVGPVQVVNIQTEGSIGERTLK